ncbi:hypothetical protein BH09ACT10_BH09ACT10_12150 [soil metagenome]
MLEEELPETPVLLELSELLDELDESVLVDEPVSLVVVELVVPESVEVVLSESSDAAQAVSAPVVMTPTAMRAASWRRARRTRKLLGE